LIVRRVLVRRGELIRAFKASCPDAGNTNRQLTKDTDFEIMFPGFNTKEVGV
jgi:hypothetical protein